MFLIADRILFLPAPSEGMSITLTSTTAPAPPPLPPPPLPPAPYTQSPLTTLASLHPPPVVPINLGGGRPPPSRLYRSDWSLPPAPSSPPSGLPTWPRLTPAWRGHRQASRRRQGWWYCRLHPLRSRRPPPLIANVKKILTPFLFSPSFFPCPKPSSFSCVPSRTSLPLSVEENPAQPINGM